MIDTHYTWDPRYPLMGLLQDSGHTYMYRHPRMSMAKTQPGAFTINIDDICNVHSRAQQEIKLY